jgi:geranylgeranyl diphosphate synthase type II
MDNDTLRRGQPTLHVIAGEAMAILAGDGLLTEAFALMAREPREAEASLTARKVRVIEIVALVQGAAGMVGGQAIDLACRDAR